MAADSRGGGPALTSGQATEGRLRPAEGHSVIRQQLNRLAMHWSLRPADVYPLTRHMRTRTYASGEIILPSRVRSDFLGLIVRGQVGVYSGQHRAGRRVAILLPGSTFGDVTRTENQPAGATFQALTRCEIRFLRRADFEVLAQERRTGRRVAVLRRLLAWSVSVLVVFLLAILALGLTSVREAAALLPLGLGQWCNQRGDTSDSPQAYKHCAERIWTLAAKLAPDDANPLLALGTLYFEQGQMEAAEHAFEAARDLAPDLAEIHNNLGLIYAKQGEHEQAIAALRQALDLEPGTTAIEHNLALSLQAMHDYDAALIHYQRAVAFGEPQASTLVNMAVAYYETGRLSQAQDAARQALDYDQGLAPAHTVLGAVALESQQPEAALLHLRRAIALDDAYSQAYFYLGLAYKALNQPANAMNAFEQALATASDEMTRGRTRQHLRELYEAGQQESLP